MNKKIGRAVLCAPAAATTVSYSAKNGAHGVTRCTSPKRFIAPMRIPILEVEAAHGVKARLSAIEFGKDVLRRE
jgi:hypothetical protein